MFRSYLIASLCLSVLLVSGGCIKKTITKVEDSPAPAVSESASGSVTTVPVNKPVATPSIVADARGWKQSSLSIIPTF